MAVSLRQLPKLPSLLGRWNSPCHNPISKTPRLRLQYLCAALTAHREKRSCLALLRVRHAVRRMALCLSVFVRFLIRHTVFIMCWQIVSATNFALHMNSTGAVLCGTSQPYLTLTGVSRARCAWRCTAMYPTCSAVNYHDIGESCDIFSECATSFDTVANCFNYQVWLVVAELNVAFD